MLISEFILLERCFGMVFPLGFCILCIFWPEWPGFLVTNKSVDLVMCLPWVFVVFMTSGVLDANFNSRIPSTSLAWDP
jgi:hypothetical protein